MSPTGDHSSARRMAVQLVPGLTLVSKPLLTLAA